MNLSMNKTDRTSSVVGRIVAAATVALALLPSGAMAQWNQTAPGSYDYNTPANWAGNNINGNFTFTFASAGTINATFSANQTLTTPLTFATTGSAGTDTLALKATGGAATVTLGGDVSVNTDLSSGDTIVIGSSTASNALNINLGGNRTFYSVSGLDGSPRVGIVNDVTGNYGITKTGRGIIEFEGTTTFTGPLNIQAGTIELRAGGKLSGVDSITIGGVAPDQSNVIGIKISNSNGGIGGSAEQTLSDRFKSTVAIVNTGASRIDLRGGRQSIAVNQAIGSYASQSGRNEIIVHPSSAVTDPSTAISVGDFTRQSGSIVAFQGYTSTTSMNMGQIATGTAGATNVLAGTINGSLPSVALVNGIIPWAAVQQSTSPRAFATYGANGFMAYGYNATATVIPGSYVTDVNTSTATENLMVSGGDAALTGNRTANSVTFATGNAFTGGNTKTLTLTSGAGIFQGGTQTINFDFNGREGIILAGTQTTFTGKFLNTGGNGLTFDMSIGTSVFLDVAAGTDITGTIRATRGIVVKRYNTFTNSFDVSSNAVLDLWDTATNQVGGLSGAGLVRNRSGVATPATTTTLQLGNGNASGNFSGVIANGDATRQLAVTKVGNGTQTLGGVNTYTGTTIVSAGTLIVDGSIAGGAVTVDASGRLGGSGTITGATTVAGTLAAGNSIGTLSSGNLTLSATGVLDNELGRDGLTPVSDRVNVTGTVTLTSGADLKLTLYSGLTNPVSNDIFFLISNDSTDAVTGVFTKLNGLATTLDEGSPFTWKSQDWKITYKADFGTGSFTGGNDIALQVVPEPATWALLAFSLTTVMVLRRRRQA